MQLPIFALARRPLVRRLAIALSATALSLAAAGCAHAGDDSAARLLGDLEERIQRFVDQRLDEHEKEKREGRRNSIQITECEPGKTVTVTTSTGTTASCSIGTIDGENVTVGGKAHVEGRVGGSITTIAIGPSARAGNNVGVLGLISPKNPDKHAGR